MKKKYKITIGGKTYEVEVESVPEKFLRESEPTVTVPPKSPGPSMSTPPSAKTVQSPIPGKIQKVAITRGQVVTPGTLLMIIEAMKMDNEILADVEAEVEEIMVKEGDMVIIAQPLLRYR